MFGRLRWAAVLLAAAGTLAVSACSASVPQTMGFSGLVSGELEPAWTVPINSSSTNITVDDRVISTDHGRLGYRVRAYDVADGREVWSAPIGDWNPLRRTIVVRSTDGLGILDVTPGVPFAPTADYTTPSGGTGTFEWSLGTSDVGLLDPETGERSQSIRIPEGSFVSDAYQVGDSAFMTLVTRSEPVETGPEFDAQGGVEWQYGTRRIPALVDPHTLEAVPLISDEEYERGSISAVSGGARRHDRHRRRVADGAHGR